MPGLVAPLAPPLEELMADCLPPDLAEAAFGFVGLGFVGCGLVGWGFGLLKIEIFGTMETIAGDDRA